MSDEKRARMLEVDLRRRGISDRRVLDAFARTPREAFVPDDLVERAYDDAPLPIGAGQTISQPYIVAFTVAALGLTGAERVLDVGTGSGYAAAILAALARDVVSIERVPSLAAEARARLSRLGYATIHVVDGDGTLGWQAGAPYDAIAVAAGGPRPPVALLTELAVGGRLVMPVGERDRDQALVRFTRVTADTFRRESLLDVRFVPLVGADGWSANDRPPPD